jgi:hypothetical protein
MVSVWIIYHIGSNLANEKVGLTAVGILLVQPLFLHHAHAFKPETMSIALTSGAVLAALYSVDDFQGKKQVWFLISLFLIVLAIPVHMWEAVMLLPLVIIYFWHREFVRGIITGIIGTGTAVLVYLVSRIQPMGAHSLSGRFVDDPRIAILTDPSYYLSRNILDGATVICGLIVIVVSAYLLYRTRHRKWMVTGSMALAGYSVFVGVPTHWPTHGYTAWAFIAPVALFGSLLFDEVLDWMVDINPVSKDTLLISAAIVMVLSGSFFLATGERNGSSLNQEQVESWSNAGSEAKELLNDSDRLTVVLNEDVGPRSYRYYGAAIVRTGILPRGHLRPTHDTWPRVVSNKTEVSDCDVVIYPETETTISVSQCSEFTVENS